MHGFVKKQLFELEYFVYGSGKKILFAFHGFNNHAEDFKILEKFIGNEYTVVAVNVFFHGESRADEKLIASGLSKDDMFEIFIDFKLLFPSEKYTLMGYSMGGRVVLKILELSPSKIERVILIAPDGIRVTLFYRFVTNTRIGRSVLEKVAFHPGLFFRIAKTIKRLRLVTEKKYDFALGNFDTDAKRKKVYGVWLTMRNVLSERKSLHSVIRKFKIPVNLFYGKHDKIIPPVNGWKFRKGVEDLVTMDVLETGHKMLTEKTLLEITKILGK